MYFWHRHLEGADPEARTLRKWNAAYPDDQTTLDEITGFIASMNKGCDAGLRDNRVMEDLILGLEIVDGKKPDVTDEELKATPVLSAFRRNRKKGA